MKVENLAYNSITPNQIPEQGKPDAALQSASPREQRPAGAEGTGAPRSADRLSISPVWRDVADRVRVREAAPLEMIELSRMLYNTGTITFEDHVNLSFQPEINADPETDPAAHEKKDFIALWEKKQEMAVRQGAGREEIENIQRIQSILGYIDSLNDDG